MPFVCGCRNLGEALRRIGEGAAMIRTKGEAGTGDVVEAVRHARSVLGEIRRLQTMRPDEMMTYAKELGAPYELVKETAELGRLPVVNFAAGGVATPADAALMMQLGVDGVFVGSGIFKSGDPAKRAKAIVEAVTHFNDRADSRAGQPRSRRADGGYWSHLIAGRAAHRRARLVSRFRATASQHKTRIRPACASLFRYSPWRRRIKRWTRGKTSHGEGIIESRHWLFDSFICLLKAGARAVMQPIRALVSHTSNNTRTGSGISLGQKQIPCV